MRPLIVHGAAFPLPPECPKDGHTGDLLQRSLDIRHPHAAACHAPIRHVLRARQGQAPRLPRRPDHLDLIEHERQEAQLLEHPAA
jgi:hypothetical protein